MAALSIAVVQMMADDVAAILALLAPTQGLSEPSAAQGGHSVPAMRLEVAGGAAGQAPGHSREMAAA